MTEPKPQRMETVKSMDVRATLLAGIERVQMQRPDAADDARAWLDRVEILLDWIATHPKLVEIQSEAARLHGLYRGSSASDQQHTK